jgi:phosphoglycerate dehydrogenase-like enzyme
MTESVEYRNVMIENGRHVLWTHMRWLDGHREVEHRRLKEQGLTGEIVFRVRDVTDEQYRRADAIISLPDLPKEKLCLLERCKIFVTPKAGYDNLDLPAYGELGIPVSNVPDYATMDVADHAIGLILSCMKSIQLHTRALQKDPLANWRNEMFPFGRRLSTCTLGIVGLGRIGTATALRAKAFGMDVVFHDPYLPPGVDRALGIRRVGALRELVSQSDVLSLHVPLTEETTNLIGKEVLNWAKPGIILINTSRGEVIDFDELYHAMKEDQVVAIGIDVIPGEIEGSKPRNPRNLRLLRAWCDEEAWIQDRIVITPHVAYLTAESALDMRTFPIDIVARYLKDGELVNCVNGEYLANPR